MALIRRNWHRMNREERVAFAENVLAHVEKNPHLDTADPRLTDLAGSVETTRDSFAAVTDLEQRLAESRAQRDADVDTLMSALEAGADAVEAATRGDPAGILSTGYEPTDGAAPQPPVMTRVINFSVSAGDFEGELDTQWDAVRGAQFYELQTCVGNPDNENDWQDAHTTGPLRSLGIAASASGEGVAAGMTRTKATLDGLPSGKRIWVRVRASVAGQNGPWSAPHSKVVP